MDNFSLVSESLNLPPIDFKVQAFQQQLSSASSFCQRSIRNGPDYPQEVSVCTLTKKIQMISGLLGMLNGYKNIPIYVQKANTFSMHYTMELNKLNQQLVSAKSNLLKRKQTIPVSMSTKPSPERYNPNREIRGKE